MMEKSNLFEKTKFNRIRKKKKKAFKRGNQQNYFDFRLLQRGKTGFFHFVSEICECSLLSNPNPSKIKQNQWLVSWDHLMGRRNHKCEWDRGTRTRVRVRAPGLMTTRLEPRSVMSCEGTTVLRYSCKTCNREKKRPWNRSSDIWKKRERESRRTKSCCFFYSPCFAERERALRVCVWSRLQTVSFEYENEGPPFTKNIKSGSPPNCGPFSDLAIYL